MSPGYATAYGDGKIRLNVPKYIESCFGPFNNSVVASAVIATALGPACWIVDERQRECDASSER